MTASFLLLLALGAPACARSSEPCPLDPPRKLADMIDNPRKLTVAELLGISAAVIAAKPWTPGAMTEREAESRVRELLGLRPRLSSSSRSYWGRRVRLGETGITASIEQADGRKLVFEADGPYFCVQGKDGAYAYFRDEEKHLWTKRE